MFGRFTASLTAKILSIGFFTLVLLIPLSQVRSLVFERQGMRATAQGSIGDAWGGSQVIGPPLLAVPWRSETRVGETVIVRTGLVQLLPGQARMDAVLEPEVRHLGIYSVPVYTAALQISGVLDNQSLEGLTRDNPERTLEWNRARLMLPLTDVRGIREVGKARLDGRDVRLGPANYLDVTGVGGNIDASALVERKLPFEFNLRLAGSGEFKMLPLARVTNARVSSTWVDPNFSAGAFLPAHYKLDQQGFEADWQVLELNRNIPQAWYETVIDGPRLMSAAFGVNLYQPVDTYQRNERAVKYAFLFIAITFMSIFLWEQLSRQRLHAMQYLLVGLALCVFYLLLLALSEHISFAYAYLSSAVALVGIVGVYLAGVLRSKSAGIVASGAIAAVYGLLYLLVLSEEYALLLGSIFVFVVLATIMLVTRRVDWSSFAGGGASEAEVDRGAGLR